MIERPSYGYGLQQQMAERLGFLGLAESAVYKTIERLEEDGWVEEVGAKEVGQTRRGAPRILYQATDRGADEFRRWMATPSDRSVVRDELQVKLVLSDPADLPQLLKMAEEQERECLAELSTLVRPSLAVAATLDIPWGAAARMMVDDFKTRWLESLVDWLAAISQVMEERMELHDLERLPDG